MGTINTIPHFRIAGTRRAMSLLDTSFTEQGMAVSADEWAEDPLRGVRDGSRRTANSLPGVHNPRTCRGS